MGARQNELATGHLASGSPEQEHRTRTTSHMPSPGLSSARLFSNAGWWSFSSQTHEFGGFKAWYL